MNTSRLQHLIPAGLVFTLAAIVTWLSFTQEPASSFLFPRIISIAFIILATWNLIRAAAGLAKVGGGISAVEMQNIGLGLIVMLVYVFWAAKGLGFYVASLMAFFLVYSIYDADRDLGGTNHLNHFAKVVSGAIVFAAASFALWSLSPYLVEPLNYVFGILDTPLQFFVTSIGVSRASSFLIAMVVVFAILFPVARACNYDPLYLWSKRGLVTSIFMTSIYGLFASLLQVQTPRGIFF